MSTISIIIPVWNTGVYLRESVESALAELKGVTGEIVIVDDHSDDPYTIRILAQIESLDSRIRVFRNDTGNKGPGAARNFGVDKSSSEWLMFLDSDDVLLSGCLDSMLSVIRSHPEVGWLAADFLEWHPGSEFEGKPYYYNRQDRYEVVRSAYASNSAYVCDKPVRNLFDEPIAVFTLTVMVKRDVFLSVGGFSEMLAKTEDVHLWLKLARFAVGFAFIPRTVAKYRIRNDSLNHEDQPIGIWWARLYLGFYRSSEYRNYRKSLRRLIAKSYLRDSYYFRRERRSWKTAQMSIQSIRWYPFDRRPWKNIISGLAIAFGII